MALEWSFDRKAGEITYLDNFSGREYIHSLYQGNAYLIEVKEWSEDGKGFYDVRSFAFDKNHLSALLGLAGGKGNGENIFTSTYYKLTKLVLYRDNCRNTREIERLFRRAFDGSLDIKVV